MIPLLIAVLLLPGAAIALSFHRRGRAQRRREARRRRRMEEAAAWDRQMKQKR